jgi:uncharacterized protein (TIGR02246 family)
MNDEQQIRDLIATWMSATRAGDLGTVLGLMTDDAVFLVAGRPPFGKQEFAQQMTPSTPGAPMPTFDGHSDIQEVHVEGNLAYVRSELTVDTTPPDGPTTRRTGHTLTVLRKTGGRWQLARDANLLTPVKL